MSMLLVVLIFLSGCAGSSQYMVKATPTAGPSTEKALIYFMRPSGMGFAINFQIWDGDHFVGLNQTKSYFVPMNANPGNISLWDLLKIEWLLKPIWRQENPTILERMSGWGHGKHVWILRQLLGGLNFGIKWRNIKIA